MHLFYAMPDLETTMNEKFVKLWDTKNKNDEWWSSFVTSPLVSCPGNRL